MSTPLLKRLTEQLTAQGGIKDPEWLARSLLIKRGQMTDAGKLTAQGMERQEMGASGRAIDRATKRSSHTAEEYKYSAKTNRATLKK
jgi:hypothetical protein